jgi:N-acetylglucosamine-6-phosphate deacetylase
LADEGVVCSISHTQCTIEQARAAVDAGARLVTHMFDTFVLPEMSDPGVYPAALTDYLLVEDRVVCEIIGDGTHVHPLLVEKALRCKTPQRVAFVTDGSYGAGLPPGRYVRPDGTDTIIHGPNDGVRSASAPANLSAPVLSLSGAGLHPAVIGRLETCPTIPGRAGAATPCAGDSRGGRCETCPTGDSPSALTIGAARLVLSGSALTPIDNFRNAIRIFGKDLATASHVCSTTPARLMGLNKGQVAPGRDADLIILNRELDVLCTIGGGEVLYQK